MEPRPLYDGDEAKSIFDRSYSLWKSALHMASSTPQIPQNSFDLTKILHRTPSLPDSIPSDATFIEGNSTWINSDTSCDLKKKGIAKVFVLRKRYPIKCSISSSPAFSHWEGTPNNGIALLVLGWAYILTAELAERQHLTMEYRWSSGKPSSTQRPALRLNTSPRAVTWWKALVTPGSVWSIAGHAGQRKVSPWGVEVEDIGLDVADDVDTGQRPLSSREAACSLAQFCQVFGLEKQCSAALAAVLTFPLHSSYTTGTSAKIELPIPSLTYPSLTCRSIDEEHDAPPTEYPHLGFYMSLSICPDILGPLLWSVFWEPDVPCNFAGAWLQPLNTVLKPIIESNNLEVLAKVMSFTDAAPLWLGLALCGPQGIINSIVASISDLTPFPHTQPDTDSAAWTGIAQSFLHIRPPGPYYLRNGPVSRANVWRLRHDCHSEYKDTAFRYAPLYGWPPFGEMREEDVEFEIRPHLRCSHEWKYVHWTWRIQTDGNTRTVESTDPGFSLIHKTSPTRPPPEQTGVDGGECTAEAISKISKKATRANFLVVF